MKEHICKYYIFYVIGVIILTLMVIPYVMIQIEIVGDRQMELNYGDSYVELGAKGKLGGKEVSVEVIGTIETDKLGKQEVSYVVKNKIGFMRKVKRSVVIVDKEAPVLELLGDMEMRIRVGETFTDPGYTMIDNYLGDITKDVTIEGKVDTSKEGTYELFYRGKDSSNNEVVQKRTVMVIAAEITYQDKFNGIDNSPRTWWSGNKKNHERPVQGAGATEDELKPYDAYYMGPDEKVIYLTFDEGGNDTYVKEIADVLSDNGVSGTFFFCGNFVKSNPDLMKQLVKQGHSVGNHGYNHRSMYEFSIPEKFDSYLSEIRRVEEVFYHATGVAMDKVYREPRGDFSLRSLAIAKEMGYKSYFWSADYLDYKENVAAETALHNYLSRYHNGAIYLIHPKNKGNYLAMDSFIKKMKELGYRFDLVKNIG